MRPGLRHKKLTPHRQLWTGEEEAACRAEEGSRSLQQQGGQGQSPAMRTPGFLSPHCVFSSAPSKLHLDMACFLPLALTGTIIPLRLDTGDQTVIWAVRRTAEAEAATQPQRP